MTATATAKARDYAGPAVLYPVMYRHGVEVLVITTPWLDAGTKRPMIGVRLKPGGHLTPVLLSELTVKNGAV